MVSNLFLALSLTTCIGASSIVRSGSAPLNYQGGYVYCADTLYDINDSTSISYTNYRTMCPWQIFSYQGNERNDLNMMFIADADNLTGQGTRDLSVSQNGYYWAWSDTTFSSTSIGFDFDSNSDYLALHEFQQVISSNPSELDELVFTLTTNMNDNYSIVMFSYAYDSVQDDYYYFAGRIVKFGSSVSTGYIGHWDTGQGSELDSEAFNILYYWFNPSNSYVFINFGLYLTTSDFTYTDSNIYTNGYRTGYSTGYDVGYSTGHSTGYNEGFSTASSTCSNGTSWFGLFATIGDTPVAMLRSLFSVDVFGVNLFAVVGSLIALLVVVKVIRWVV